MVSSAEKWIKAIPTVESHFTRALTSRRYVCEAAETVDDEEHSPDTENRSLLDRWIGSKSQLYR